VITWR